MIYIKEGKATISEIKLSDIKVGTVFIGEIETYEATISEIKLSDIKVGTVSIGKIETYEDDLFLKTHDEIISLSNPQFACDNPDCIVKNFKEVDIEITVL